MITKKYATRKELIEAGYTRQRIKLWWYKPKGTLVYTHKKDDFVYYYQYQNKAYKRTKTVL